MSTDGKAPPLAEAQMEALLALLGVAESALAEGESAYAGEAIVQARKIASRISLVQEAAPAAAESPRDERVTARKERLRRVPLKRRKQDVLAFLRQADRPKTAKQIADELGLTMTVARRVIDGLREDDSLTLTGGGHRGQAIRYSATKSGGGEG